MNDGKRMDRFSQFYTKIDRYRLIEAFVSETRNRAPQVLEGFI